MLKECVEEKLNNQINAEIFSAYLYLAMGAYFESISLKGFAHWMQMQVREELTHASRMIEYVNDRGGRAIMTAIEAPKTEWDSPEHVMDEVYEHECLVSEKINECVSLAIAENDHPTNGFLQWFVSEQVEEEASADEIVQKLKLIGGNPGGLYMLDKEVGERQLGPSTLATMNLQPGAE